MKFTEGYWLRSENVQASYATQAFTVEEIEGGMRIVAPERPIKNRGDAMNLATITVDFIAYGEGDILVKAAHYQAYDKKEPRFPLHRGVCPVTVTVTEQEALMEAGEITVRVNRENWEYRFEARGEVITSCGFRNLGYMRMNKKPATMFARDNYLVEDFDSYMLTELSLAPGECVYGFGEQFTAFVKNGQVVECWNEDGGTSSQVAYKNIPFYMTNKGYGIFVDHSGPVAFEVASEKVEYVGFSIEGEELRYHFLYGPTPKQILKRYTDLTGKPALPPSWSFGLWLTTSFTTNYDEKTTSAFIDGMAERDIPLRVFHFDCYWMKGLHWCDFEWDQDTFSDVPAMLKRYKEEKGLKICVWINPYIAQGTALFKEAMEKGYLLRRADGRGYRQTDHWQPGMGWVDFTNPQAAAWYTDQLKKLLDAGVDCFKSDFGERIPIDVIYYDGSDPKSMHNYYAYLYNKTVFEFLQKEKGEGEAVLFARSATACCQQFPVHWGGDCSASYVSMAETLRGGLSFALSGFSFWSHDISGFELTASPDLYKRWAQFGLLSTHSRLHGSTSYRVPWLFDEEACDVVRYFTLLKCSLMPYLYQYAVMAHETGIPVMRPMVLEYPSEPGMSYLDMQYMLGESLLVAPIFSESGKVSYYLPEGTWTHLLNGEVREGGRWYEDVYDYFSLPVYVRENTLLPMREGMRVPDYDYREDTCYHLYALKDGGVASCFVTDKEGAQKVDAKAKRRGKQLTLQISEMIGKPSILLHGIGQNEIKNVQGASLEAAKDGIRILPEREEVIVEFA